MNSIHIADDYPRPIEVIEEEVKRSVGRPKAQFYRHFICGGQVRGIYFRTIKNTFRRLYTKYFCLKCEEIVSQERKGYVLPWLGRPVQ